MKRIFSLMLAGVMACASLPVAFATNIYDSANPEATPSLGTQVVFEGQGAESYTITVPAKLTPGASGTVTLSGTWADNRIVTVTADSFVVLHNNLSPLDAKELIVRFPGIAEAGNNIASQTFEETVAVDPIENALFGTWTGKFNYNVSVKDQNQGLHYGKKYVLVDSVPNGSMQLEEWLIFYADGSSEGATLSSPPGSFIYGDGVVTDNRQLFTLTVSEDGKTFVCNAQGVYWGTYKLEEPDEPNNESQYKIVEGNPTYGAVQYKVENNRLFMTFSDVFYEDFGGREILWNYLEQTPCSVYYVVLREGEEVNPIEITDVIFNKDEDSVSVPYMGPYIYNVTAGNIEQTIGVFEIPLEPAYLQLNQPYQVVWVDGDATSEYDFPLSMTFKKDYTMDVTTEGGVYTEDFYLMLETLIISDNEYDIVEVDKNGRMLKISESQPAGEKVLAIYSLGGLTEDLTMLYFATNYVCTYDNNPQVEYSMVDCKYVFYKDGSASLYAQDAVANVPAGFCVYEWDSIIMEDSAVFTITEGGKKLEQYIDGELARVFEVEYLIKPT